MKIEGKPLIPRNPFLIIFYYFIQFTPFVSNFYKRRMSFKQQLKQTLKGTIMTLKRIPGELHILTRRYIPNMEILIPVRIYLIWIWKNLLDKTTLNKRGTAKKNKKRTQQKALGREKDQAKRTILNFNTYGKYFISLVKEFFKGAFGFEQSPWGKYNILNIYFHCRFIRSSAFVKVKVRL